MKKFLSLALTLCLMLLPTLTTAEGLLSRAFALNKALTTLSKLNVAESLTGVEQFDTAIHDLAEALQLSCYAQHGQIGVAATLEGTDVFSAEAAVDGDTLYVKSPWLGQDTLAFSGEELQGQMANYGAPASVGGATSFDHEAAEALLSGNIAALFPKTQAAAQPIAERAVTEDIDEAPYTKKITLDVSYSDFVAVDSALLQDLSDIAAAISLKVNGQDVAPMLAQLADQLTEAPTQITMTQPVTVMYSEGGEHLRADMALEVTGEDEDGKPQVSSTTVTLTTDAEGNTVQSNFSASTTVDDSCVQVLSSFLFDLETMSFSAGSTVLGADLSGEDKEPTVLLDLQLNGGFNEDGTYSVILTAKQEDETIWAVLTVESAEAGVTLAFTCGDGTPENGQTRLQVIAIIGTETDEMDIGNGAAEPMNVFGVFIQITAYENGQGDPLYITLYIYDGQVADFHLVQLEFGTDLDQPAGTLLAARHEVVEGSVTEGYYDVELDIPSVLGIPAWLHLDYTQYAGSLKGHSEFLMGMGEDEQEVVFLTVQTDSEVSEAKPSIVTDKAVHLLSLPEEEQQEWIEAITKSVELHVVKAMQALPVSVLQVVQALMGGE